MNTAEIVAVTKPWINTKDGQMNNKERILLFAKVAEATYSDPKDSKKVFDSLGYKTIKFFNVSIMN